MAALPLALAALIGALLALLASRALSPGGAFTAGRHLHFPKHFALEPAPEAELPSAARAPLQDLRRRLERLGFKGGDHLFRPKDHAEVLFVPFVHTDERSVFVMGIEAGWRSRSELMLHIVTPLVEGRRVETTTLPALRRLPRTASVDLRIITEASSIEELWSGHRRALMEYERRERQDFAPEAWSDVIAPAYEAWLAAAVRAQRIQLSPDGTSYRLRRVFS